MAVNKSILPRKGLANFKSWLNETTFPRKISPTDIDLVLHDGPTNRALILEFKSGEDVPTGQKWLLTWAETLPGVSVLVIDESRIPEVLDGTPIDLRSPVRVCRPPDYKWQEGTLEQVVQRIDRWYQEGPPKRLDASRTRKETLNKVHRQSRTQQGPAWQSFAQAWGA